MASDDIKPSGFLRPMPEPLLEDRKRPPPEFVHVSGIWESRDPEPRPHRMFQDAAPPPDQLYGPDCCFQFTRSGAGKMPKTTPGPTRGMGDDRSSPRPGHRVSFQVPHVASREPLVDAVLPREKYRGEDHSCNLQSQSVAASHASKVGAL
jgi:hypothetical protein